MMDELQQHLLLWLYQSLGLMTAHVPAWNLMPLLLCYCGVADPASDLFRASQHSACTGWISLACAFDWEWALPAKLFRWQACGRGSEPL